MMTELPPKNLTFLLADDHAMIRHGLAMLIDDIHPDHQIIHASDIKNIKLILEQGKIDIAILDASFPDGNCLSILPELRRNNPRLVLLIYSGIDEKTHALQYINAGANGFLSKLSEDHEVESALRQLIKEGRYLSAQTQSLLIHSLQNPALVNPLSCLTDRELEVALLYADGTGNIEIAAQLNIKQNTVSTLKKRVFEKLKIDNIVQLIGLVHDYRH